MLSTALDFSVIVKGFYAQQFFLLCKFEKYSCKDSVKLLRSLSSFEGYPLQIRHKQDWGRGIILLLPQTAVLLESDAGGVIRPALSFVIQNRQTSCSMCIGDAV